jgi:dUTP pyrophosphatase
MSKTMKVKKFSKDVPDFKIDNKGDWIDLFVERATISENTEEAIEYNQGFKDNDFNEGGEIWYNKGDIVIVGLGVAIELPYSHEGEIRPRSSTLKKTGLLLTNSVGTIDESYKGDSDEWQGVFYATRNGMFKRFDRLLQFKVIKKMVKPTIEYVDTLGNENRGGYGTSGN